MAAKTYNAGTIFLQVVPVFGDTMNAIKRKAKDANEAWGAEIEKGAKETGERAGKAQGEAQGKALAAEAKKSGDKAGSEYAGAFQEKIRSSLRGAQREIDTLNFKTLSDDAEDRVKRIGKLFKELDAEITPDMDDKKVRAKLDFLRADLKKLTEGKHELHIDENLGEVIAKVEGGLKVIDKALDKNRVIEIETRISDRDLGSFEKKLRDTARRAAKSLGDSLDPAVKKLKARLDSLGDAEIGIDISAASARAEIISVDKALQALPDNVDVDLGVNSAVAHAELLAFREAVNAIDGMDVDIPVKVNGTGRAMAEMAATTAAAGGMRAALIGAFQAGSGGAENAANSFRSFNFVILAAVTLIPALIPMIGALGGGLLALIPILGAVGAGLGTMLIGFSGIGDAVGALGDVQDNAAKDSLSAGKTMSAAANGVADAERALADARRSGAQAVEDAARAVKRAKESAAEAIESALQQQQDAQEAYADSVRDVRDAERDLAEARKQAALDLMGLDNDVEQNQIDIGQQTIAVFEAQATYDTTMSDGSATNQEKDTAALALQEAELKLKELRQAQEQLAKEKKKADKEGVDGTEVVQSAEEALTAQIDQQRDARDALADSEENLAKVRKQSAQQVADAERNLARARQQAAQGVANAQRNLTRAQQGLSDAAEQTGEIGSASMQKLEKAMDKLGPAGQRFARFLFGLRSRFYDLRDSIQEAMLPPIQRAMQTIISKYGPQIQGFAVSLATVIGGLFEKLGNRMTKSPAWKGFFAMMADLGPTLLGNFGVTMINFMTAFASIMTTVAPFSERLSVAMVKISQAFADWTASASGTSQIQDFMAYAAKVGPEVANFFWQLWRAVVNIGRALAPWGEMVMNALAGILGFIGSMDPKTLGTITTSIIALTVAFQAAVGIVALAYAGSAVFATTAGTLVFALVLLGGTLLTLYHRFESVRNAVHAVTDFVIEHRDTLLDLVVKVGAVIAAYKAWKAIMATSRAIMAGYAAASYGAAGATYAQGFAAKSAYVATRIWNATAATAKLIQDGLLLTTIRQNAMWALYIIRMTVVNAATKAYAAVQAVLNAVMSANPIFLVVLAIAALIAVFVVLFKRNKTFHDAVVRVWGAIKNAAVAVWGAITDAFWATVHGIQAAWNWLKPIFSAIGQVIVFLWDHIWKPYLTLLWTFWSNTFKAVVWVVKNILFPIIDLLGHIIIALWRSYFKVALRAIQIAWKVLVFAVKLYWNLYLKPIISAFGTAIKFLWEKFVKPNLPKIEAAWNAVKDAVHTAWNKWISPAIEGFKTGMGLLKSKVETVMGAISTAWDGLKSIFAKPIVFVVDTILNNGLIAGFNKIAEFVGSKKMSDIPLSDDIRNAANGGKAEKHARGGIIGRRDAYADGGTMPGYTPGRDVHRFFSPTAGYLELSGGEPVMRPEFGKVVGTGWVDKMNMIARTKGERGVRQALGYAKGGVTKFARGGTWRPFWPEPGGVVSSYPGHDGIDLNAPGDNGPTGTGGSVGFYSATPGTVNYVGTGRGYGIATFINSPVGELVYGHAYPGSTVGYAGMPVQPGTYLGKVGMTGHATGPHLHFGFPGGTPAGALGVLSGAVHGKGKSAGPSVPSWLKGFIKGPFDYMKNLISKPIAAMKEKFGDNDMLKTIAAIPVNLAKSVAHKALDVIPGPIKAVVKGAGAVAGAVGDGASAVADHIGLKDGGVLPYNGTMKYDAGGYLPPGLTSVVNLTGKPEPVFTHDQFEKGIAGGEVFHYEPHFEGSDLTAADVVRDMDHARRRMRRQGRYARTHS